MSESENTKKLLLSFKPTNDWYDENQKLYAKNTIVNIYANEVRCIIGCNGSGKSTLLQQIESEFKKLNYVEIKELKNPFYGMFSKKKEYAGFVVHFNSEFEIIENYNAYPFDRLFMNSMSTGESLYERFGSAAKFIGESVKMAKAERKPVILLWDDCDVGTSIDVQDDIVEFVSFIKNELEKDNLEFSIILTANSYELCKTFDCYDCRTLKPVKFKSYDRYKKFVLKTRKRKDARYKSDT